MHRFVRKQQNGFSLIETTLALGVFAFAVVALIGLIPTAITTHKEAKTATVLAQIHQRMIAEIMLTDGSVLKSLDGLQINFDIEGTETTGPTVVYSAKFIFADVVLPGGMPSRSMNRVKIIAIKNPTGTAVPITAPATASVIVTKAENAS